MKTGETEAAPTLQVVPERLRREARPIGGRVAHVLLRFVEMSETFIPEAILQLERCGWDPWVVTTHVVNREQFRYPADERIRVARRPSLRRLLANRMLLRNLPGRQASWLEPQIAAVNPDLVHAHFGHVAAATAPAARRLGLPFIASFHGTDLTCFPREMSWARRGYRWVFAQAACVIVPSRFLEGKLRELGYAGRAEVVPAGICLERVRFTGPRAADPDGGVRLLLVARQDPVKGTDVLLRALPGILTRVPGVRLDVIGYGQEAERNASLSRELGVADRVRFLGGQTHARTLAAIGEADLVVVPSRRAPNGDEESSSLVTREALAIGVPVVATRSGGIPENFAPEHRRELVAPGDPYALAARVCATLAARDEWPQRARAGRGWMESEFDSSRLAARMANIYEEVVADHRARAAHELPHRQRRRPR